MRGKLQRDNGVLDGCDQLDKVIHKAEGQGMKRHNFSGGNGTIVTGQSMVNATPACIRSPVTHFKKIRAGICIFVELGLT
jgi:hypothetical protein